jgi:enoyl-CoA hydratase/carnithine racemase
MTTSNDIHIRKNGKIGHITLDRPDAMNALTYEMCIGIENALDQWADDSDVHMVLIDAAGDRAFCAGGDVQKLYDFSKSGDLEFGRKFWADEYRLNAKIVNFPKPYVALMQGFTMGGGVGVSCHGSHRVVCETSQIAMPECGIGLIPDIGGSMLLARAPGRCGEYLGATTSRMGPEDSIYAGFADYFIPIAAWDALRNDLIETGDWTVVDAAAQTPPDGKLQSLQAEIDLHFCGDTMGDIYRSLLTQETEFTQSALKKLSRPSPLAMVCAIEVIHRARATDTIEAALSDEYKYTYRAVEHTDFLEGIRAAVVDKDRNPTWRHSSIEDVGHLEATKLLMPLGENALKL